MASPDEESALAGKEAQKLNKSLRVAAGINVDTRAVRDLGTAFASVRQELHRLKQEFEEVEKLSAKVSRNVKSTKGGVSGKSSIGDTNVVTALQSSTTEAGGGGGGGGGKIMSALKAFGGGGEGGGNVAAGGLSVASAAVTKAMATIDARVDRNRDYALSADRMSVLYQQMTGKSQVQVQDQYRKPLTNYRLGAGGINTLLGLQASTGINAAQQASSVEAVRTYSGYSLSAGDTANMLQNLASAPVANRMFLMGGGGLIGPGGRQNSMQSVLQNIVKTSGLTNEKLVDSSFAPGSLTRAKLSMMGVSEDMQDTVLQYAKQNIQYRKKGGKGMYNASDKASRKLMGIEDNFATQAEETDRIRTAREEQMYSRQADNYAALEKQTQRLTKVFAALEDKMSGVIGARTSHRISSSILGTVGSIVGGIAGAFTGTPMGVMAGITAGNMAGTGLGMMFGEQNSDSGSKGSPSGGSTKYSGNDSTTYVPTYGSDNKVQYRSIEAVKSMPSFVSMKSQMKQRVLNMMRANPKVGFGQGYRSKQEQDSLFFGRYKKTNRPDSTPKVNHKDRKYQGVWWELINPNSYPAAAPGNSMHGAGLAVDLYLSDADAQSWAYAHAQEFGLAGAGSVDPPHFQPIEFPDDSVNSYLSKGAPWGTEGIDKSEGATPVGASPLESASSSDPSSPKSMGDTPLSVGGSGAMSIAERVSQDMPTIAGGGGGGAGGGSTPTPVATNVDAPGPVSGGMKGEEVAKMLYGQGFRGNDLIKMLAISYRESNWVPSVHRNDPSTGDNSWGLFQLNTLDNNWNFWKDKISKPEDLLDPQTNVRMAKALFDASVKERDGNGFYYWGDYGKSGPGSSNGNLDIPAATAVVKKAGLGEAYDGGGGVRAPLPTSGGSVSISGGHTFHISPNVTIASSGNNAADLKKLAKELARMVQHEIQVTALRGN